jgi:sugar phosphate isomerase/epimerase
VISIKDDAGARVAFEYARDIGASTIVCFPELAVLPTLDKLVKEFDINIAIHNHGPEAKMFKSPYEAMDAIAAFDPRVGLCIDVGHTARAGVDPAEAIRKCKDRLHDCHFKDINSVHAPSAGKAELEIGRGVLDIKGMLMAMLEIKYAGHVGFEHEKTAENPLPGLAEGMGYTKGVLSCI